MIFTNPKFQKIIASATLASFGLLNLATPLSAYAQAAPDVGTITRPTIDVGDLSPVGTSPDITADDEAELFREAGLGRPVIKPQEAVGEITATIQQGEDLCKDIKGSPGQVAMQIGIKIATIAAKNVGKVIAKKLLGAVGKNIWNNIGALPGGEAIKGTLKQIGGIFGIGKKTTQKVAIEKGGPLEDLQKKIFNKECLLKPFVRSMSSMLIKSMTSSVVTWIQGYDPETGRSNVGFVGNFKQSLRQELDFESGQFLNKLTGINLCGGTGFERFLKIRLQTPYSYPDSTYGITRQLGCTATDIVRRVKYDYATLQSNFAGGWPAFIKYSLEPQNNPYGAYLIALDAKILAESSAAQSFEKGFTAGAGFLGFATNEYINCVPVSEDSRKYYNSLKSEASSNPESKSQLDYAKRQGIKDKGGGKWEKCDVFKLTRTPGQTTAFMLNKVVGAGIDQATVATEMDNLIAATIKATVNRIVGGSGGRSKGLFDAELAYAIDKDAVKTGGENTEEVNIPILQLIARADAAISYLDENVLQSTINSMAANLAPAGAEQLFPGQVDPNNPQAPSLSYFDIAQDLRTGALDASRTGLLLSQADFTIYRDSFNQKKQIQDIKKQLVTRLLEMLGEGEDLQSSISAIGATALGNSLNSASVGLPIAGSITLYGTIEKNLADFVADIFETAERAGRKVTSLNTINFINLPNINNNYESQIKMRGLADNINFHKNFLDSISTQFDPSKVRDMDLEKITFFLNNPSILPAMQNIMDRSLNVDESIKDILGTALAIPQDQLSATSTPIFIPPTSTPGGNTPALPGFFEPALEAPVPIP